MVTENGRKHLPPYVSYRTFGNFINGLQQNLPSRIDRSYWGDMFSGSNGTQLMAALRFLKLIDANGKPMDQLKQLAAVRGEQRAPILRRVTIEAFDFVTKGPLELERATYGQLQEAFHSSFQLTDDVSRKCVKFFIAMAGDAGINLSTFITKKTRTPRTAPGTKMSVKKPVIRTNRNAQIPMDLEEVPQQSEWNNMLLAKFPSFDPAWNDELKLKWFIAFDELLKKGLGRS